MLFMNIILDSNKQTAIVFNLSDLQHYLERITDTRSPQGKIYSLPLVLTYILLAKLAGCNTPNSIFSWVRKRQGQLLKLIDTHHNRVPCLNTYRTIMDCIIDADELADVLNQYLLAMYGGQQSVLICIDGKTMRGTIPKGSTSGVHLLAAYLPEEGIVLGQVEVMSEENEITAVHELINDLPLKGRVVCADAMQTQRKLSVEVMAKGGDYLWFVKENQPTLLMDIEQFFKPPRHAKGWHISELPRTVAQQTCKGHGRIETRQLTVMEDSEAFLDWPGVRQVFKIERDVIELNSGRTSSEVAYGLTSRHPETASAEQLLDWTRQYWGIENGLHYRRDVTLNEDSTRMSLSKMPRVMATLNNFIVGLTQKLGYLNLAEARRVFDFSIAAQIMA